MPIFFNGAKKTNQKIAFFRKGKKRAEKDSSGLTKLKKGKMSYNKPEINSRFIIS